MQLAAFSDEAGAVATRHQRMFFRLHLGQLVMLVSAALVAAVPRPEGDGLDVGGVVAAVLFGLSLVLRVVMAQRGDEAAWYSARRAAETAKSLCYRFAFGATGYERSRTAAETERRFIDDFGTLGSDVLLVELTERPEGYSEITAEMRSARLLTFDQARHRYLVERITDQERWFTSRSVLHLGRSRLWLTLMLGAEAGGLTLAILKATGRFAIDLGGFVGLMSALAAAVLAWSQLRQHSTLAGTYRAEAVALRSYGSRLPLVTEEEWPGFVAAVEGSLTAEHSRWQSLIGFGR